MILSIFAGAFCVFGSTTRQRTRCSAICIPSLTGKVFAIQKKNPVDPLENQEGNI
jgi:hypothetical protein